MKISWFDLQDTNNELIYPASIGYVGPFLFGLSGFSSNHIEREQVIAQPAPSIDADVPNKVCCICFVALPKIAGNHKTCGKTCGLIARQRRRQQENQMFAKRKKPKLQG